MEDDRWLALMLCSCTSVTELDKLAKSLVTVFHKHGKAVDLLKDIIVKEVEIAGNFLWNFVIYKKIKNKNKK